MSNKRSAVSNQQVNPPIPPLLKGGKGGFEDGFTLIELMITMVAFVLVIASVSSIFLGLVNQFKQQSKIAETNIEGITGLEILRQDIEHAGYGLPWNFQSHINYNEAAAAPASNYNDSPSNLPRAILSGNDTGFNNSDYLVIKSINVARNYACSKWTTLRTTGTRVWVPNKENVNFNDTDGTVNNNVRVIVLYPGSTESNSRTLIVNGTFSTPYSTVTSSTWSPIDPTETRIIYSVDPADTDLRMPFNRADYFITTVDSDGTNITPQRCAPNTGALVKAVLRHNDGGFDIMPLLDCVADMQVIYRRDTNDDGIIDNNTDDISVLTADKIREQVKEVRVYILAHEGQRDTNYTYPNNSVTVGEFGLEKNFDLTSIANYQNYRWKVYTIVVNSNNLR
jgi:prepilin-type N-terminal cleavage/methylation domain-containing protein